MAGFMDFLKLSSIININELIEAILSGQGAFAAAKTVNWRNKAERRMWLTGPGMAAVKEFVDVTATEYDDKIVDLIEKSIPHVLDLVDLWEPLFIKSAA